MEIHIYRELIATSENKAKIKHEKLRIKIRDLVRSITKKLDDCAQKYKKEKFNSDGNLPLNKRIQIPIVTLVIKAVFHENSKNCPQGFLDECLYKI